MNNIINPYTSSRTHIQERSTSPNEAEEELHSTESNKIDSAKLIANNTDLKATNKEQTKETESLNSQTASKVQEVDELSPSRFINTLEGVIDRNDEISIQNENTPVHSALPGLSLDEQQMIYRYFPESPSLELRLYKQDMSTNKVTPRSVGSRVDIRG